MSRPTAFLARFGLDLLIVLAAAETALTTILRDDAQRPDGPTLWFEVVAVAATVLVLLGRTRYPFAAPAYLWISAAALSFLDGRLIEQPAGIFVAGMGAAVLLGNQRSLIQARSGLAIVLGSALIVVYNGDSTSTDNFISVPVLFAIGWLVGWALRERTERTEAAEERAETAEREREAAARVAVAEERGRIARELHDIVAHSVSVMVLQVGAVRHRMPPDPAEDREALKNVEDAGRTALADMRRLLNAMRQDGDPAELTPHPGLDDLGRLMHDVRAAGLAVQLQVVGQPAPLPPGLDLSAYRIVQEGLTNSLKHSGAAGAEVTVSYASDELLLEVRDNGAPDRTATHGNGHGLVGIRERVKIFGGELTAGPAPGGGFLVRARLPLGGHAP